MWGQFSMKYHLYYLRDNLAALESAGKLNLERILDVRERSGIRQFSESLQNSFRVQLLSSGDNQLTLTSGTARARRCSPRRPTDGPAHQLEASETSDLVQNPTVARWRYGSRC